MAQETTDSSNQVAVIVPGEDGDLSQFVAMHSLIDAPTGFSFATDGTSFFSFRLLTLVFLEFITTTTAFVDGDC